jgi:ABC-type phosphate/phosphonate transport system substrate-binding protein
MSSAIAALPMYDWPEIRAETDALWAGLRDRLRAEGIDAPEMLARRNADLPAVPGGIRDASGDVIAPDPATLPPDELDFPALWRHPSLLLGQTCWGPMEAGLAPFVEVVGQPSYNAFEGGEGPLYSSAVVMRRRRKGRSNSAALSQAVRAPADGRAVLPFERLRGARFVYNNPDSMSGLIGITRDLDAAGEGLDIFAGRIETGAHRASLRAVAKGEADVCAIDCRSWALARRFEPPAVELEVVGWTARRKGLPYITARATPPETVAVLRDILGAS